MISISQNQITLVAISLVPLVPAYLLFKFLPGNNAEVQTADGQAASSGLLQGLQIKLGGSFAAYFVLFMVLIYTRSSWLAVPPAPPPALLPETWHVTGRLVNTQGQPLTDKPGKDLDRSDLTFTPPSITTQGSDFTLAAIALPINASGDYIYPTLRISMSGYDDARYYLGPADHNYYHDSIPANRDPADKYIDLGNVTLSKATTAPANKPFTPY